MCTIYKNIDRLCKKHNITGGKMCADLNLSRSILTGLKSGKKKTINSTTANKIANYFNVSVDEILLPYIEPDTVTLLTGSGGYPPSRSTVNLTLKLQEQTKKTTPVSESGQNRNFVKVAGRDGSFVMRELTDDQIALILTMLDHLKPVDDDSI